MDGMDRAVVTNGTAAVKRKRSPSADAPVAPTKVAKTHNSHLHINYLTRQYPEPLPLISTEDSLPALISVIQEYDGVIQRHESMAGNLGARPLGPILIKRFERLFESPPKVLRSHGKEGTTVGWLDVVEFAKNKPEQFNLEKTRDGVRVCQFYTKQSRVEITEEDYELIASGIPDKLIPAQPILEDEEKELGTLEILSKNIEHIVQLADQGMSIARRIRDRSDCMTVSARARQINHRLKHRQKAINSRREAEASASGLFSPRSHTSKVADMGRSTYPANGDTRTSMSPSSGFTAVNSRHNDQTNGSTPLYGASAATRAELLSKFFTNSERVSDHQDYDPSRRTSNFSTPRPKTGDAKMKSKPGAETDYISAAANCSSPNPVAIPNTPSSLLPYVKPSAAERFDDSGPYKAEMVSRMELLQRGDRVQPPCDRCRRLHMDCLKNLTACLGCTKKHAKCSWKDVTDDELQNYVPPEPLHSELDDVVSQRSGSLATVAPKKGDYVEGVRDEELLGEDESDESHSDADVSHGNSRHPPIQVHVASSLQNANGQSVEQFDSQELDENMEPEVRHDIAKLRASDTSGLPSPPGAPVPAPASLPDVPTTRSEAPPDIEMEDEKPLIPRLSPQQVSYGNTEYGSVNSHSDTPFHGLPDASPDVSTPPAAPVVDPTAFEKAQECEMEMASPSVAAPQAMMPSMASVSIGD